MLLDVSGQLTRQFFQSGSDTLAGFLFTLSRILNMFACQKQSTSDSGNFPAPLSFIVTGSIFLRSETIWDPVQSCTKLVSICLLSPLMSLSLFPHF